MNTLLSGALALSLLGSPALPADSVPLFDNLGDHHHPISTPNPTAQRYFDQGVRLYYAFNHQEATRAFREAARHDPDCAMCYWGVALAFGPNINLPMDEASGAEAYAAIREASAREEHASPRERALIRATALRYGPDPAANRAARDSAYALAMKEVADAYPDDLEAATLYAEALMTLRPWSYWTQDGEPEPGTLELVAQLERVIAANPEHPGACHFFIHAVEAVEPERAVDCAERLATLMPGAGHLVHMPGHIYIRVGRYLDAIEANQHAVHADETYIQDQRPGMGIYVAGYYPHNYDFMAFAAAMAGRAEQAITAADRVANLIPEEMLRAPGMTVLQHFATRPLQMRIRFGRWDEVLSAEAPPADLPHARGMWLYARGRALVATGELEAAEEALSRLRDLIETPAMSELRLEFNDARTVLGIGARSLAGHIAAARGRHDEAIRELRAAAALEDGLVYGEPPEWSVPVRHELGAVLLAAGRHAEAEEVFLEDLRRFPENGWSLGGLAEALREMGRHAEAEAVEARLEDAWAAADVPATTHAVHAH